jgi:hypothetical protein
MIGETVIASSAERLHSLAAAIFAGPSDGYAQTHLIESFCQNNTPYCLCKGTGETARLRNNSHVRLPHVPRARFLALSATQDTGRPA